MTLNYSTNVRRKGVYQICNTETGDSYIGSSTNLYHRVKRHFCDLRKGRHGNSHFQESFNTWGENCFTAKVLSYEDTNDLVSAEKYWFDTLKPSYNKIDPKTRVMEEFSRLKISTTLKKSYALGTLKAYDQEHAKVAVCTYDVFGQKISKYDSYADCARTLGLSRNRVSEYFRKQHNLYYLSDQLLIISTLDKPSIAFDVLKMLSTPKSSRIRIGVNEYNISGTFIRTYSEISNSPVYTTPKKILRNDLLVKFCRAEKLYTFVGYTLEDLVQYKLREFGETPEEDNTEPSLKGDL